MYDINGKILGVTGKPIRNGSGSKYDIQFSDGKTYSTFDQALANKANALQNQDVTMRVDQKPSRDGTRMFDNLIDVGLFGQLGAPPAQIGTPISSGQYGPAMLDVQFGAAGGNPPPIPMASSGGGGMSDSDKQRISRFSAASTAFEFIGSIFAGAGPEALAEAVKHARRLTGELVNYGYTGEYTSGQALPVPTTPQEVAASIPDPQQAVEAGDDIPWT